MFIHRISFPLIFLLSLTFISFTLLGYCLGLQTQLGVFSSAGDDSSLPQTSAVLDMNSGDNTLYLAKKTTFVESQTTNAGTEEDTGKAVSLLIKLPSGAMAKNIFDQGRTQRSMVSLNGSEYKVSVFGNVTGLCSPTDNGCTAKDSQLNTGSVNIDTLRLWINSDGVFNINPQNIIVDTYTIPYLTIEKINPDSTFTNSEVEQWKDLLGKIEISQTN